ncbi:hypothetical protein STENM36S_04655 [Streptomyces tendae]
MCAGRERDPTRSGTRAAGEPGTAAGEARRVADAMGIPANAVRKSADVSGITLVVGADWREGTSYPKQKTPEAGDLPETSDALNGSDAGKCMDVYKPYRW